MLCYVYSCYPLWVRVSRRVSVVSLSCLLCLILGSVVSLSWLCRGSVVSLLCLILGSVVALLCLIPGSVVALSWLSLVSLCSVLALSCFVVALSWLNLVSALSLLRFMSLVSVPVLCISANHQPFAASLALERPQ
jgi:hypothetical protein